MRRLVALDLFNLPLRNCGEGVAASTLVMPNLPNQHHRRCRQTPLKLRRSHPCILAPPYLLDGRDVHEPAGAALNMDAAITQNFLQHAYALLQGHVLPLDDAANFI